MASRYHWRQRLLGSLQGQLQLATYLVVFLGFTGASSVGLLIGQRNLLANDQQLARQSIALCEDAITDLQDDPTRLEQELLFNPAPTPASGSKTTTEHQYYGHRWSIVLRSASIGLRELNSYYNASERSKFSTSCIPSSRSIQYLNTSSRITDHTHH
jgi:hypothetical protein